MWRRTEQFIWAANRDSHTRTNPHSDTHQDTHSYLSGLAESTSAVFKVIMGLMSRKGMFYRTLISEHEANECDARVCAVLEFSAWSGLSCGMESQMESLCLDFYTVVCHYALII